MAEESLIVRLLSGSRTLRGQSVAQAAQSAGVNASYWRHVEHVGPKIPSADWLRKVSHAAGSPWLSASVNEHLFLGAAWGTWANADHFGHDTSPPMAAIMSLAVRLASALQPITANPLPVEMLKSSDAAGDPALAQLFAQLSASYQLPGLGSLPAGHAIDSNAVTVLLTWGLVSGGSTALKESEEWLPIVGGGAPYVAEMLSQALPLWIAHASADNSAPTGDHWDYIQAHWGSLSARQQELVQSLIASWLSD